MTTASQGRLTSNVGSGVKLPCLAATTANITLSGPQTIDTVAVVAGDRVLVKNQTDAEDNGIYVVAGGVWTRAADWNQSGDLLSGICVPVGAGSAGAGLWQVTYSGDYTLGTTEPTFTLLA